MRVDPPDRWPPRVNENDEIALNHPGRLETGGEVETSRRGLFP